MDKQSIQCLVMVTFTAIISVIAAARRFGSSERLLSSECDLLQAASTIFTLAWRTTTVINAYALH